MVKKRYIVSKPTQLKTSNLKRISSDIEGQSLVRHLLWRIYDEYYISIYIVKIYPHANVNGGIHSTSV